MRPLPCLLLTAALLGPPPAAAGPPRDLDLAFVLDTTGSMSGEIREAKERVRQVAEALSAARPGARVRLGVVAYRDRGDEYVTKVSPLTEDVGVTDAFLSALRAGGGGDGPEDVLAGLGAALSELEWDEAADADRQVFLIGDAPAHLDYDDGPRPEGIVAEALRRRIVLNAVGCRSLSRGGVELFRSLAYGSEGTYHHVGRVELGGERPGLAEAVVATLAPEPETPARGLRLRRSEAVPPAVGQTLAVERLDDGDRCLLGISLPRGLRLDGEPEAFVSESGLDVLLPIASGQGEAHAFELEPCAPASLPVHVALLSED